MIKPEQIPEEAVEAAENVLEAFPARKDVQEAIAAALNAWPGVREVPNGVPVPILILPLSQEEKP